jgi:glutaredoxin
MNLSHRINTAGICLAWLCMAASAQAQTVYRIVGPDGKVTFSDKSPANAAQGKVASTGTGAAAAAPGASLPIELRQAASKYPVILYTAPDCSPCASGRTLLGSRGIPFSERTVTTAEDVAALKRLMGETSLPVLNIGGQRLKGYSDVEWTQYLDAAGYPKLSMLPAGYRQAPAGPLVTVAEKPVTAREDTRPADAATAASTYGPAPSNPAGIKF